MFNREIEFKPTGSKTQEVAEVVSDEADESYAIQGLKLAVEVNFTSGDVAKLERYRALGVDEVWFWEDGVLAVYHLRSSQYEQVNRSQIPALAPIDIAVMAECILIGETSRIDAGKQLLAAHPVGV